MTSDVRTTSHYMNLAAGVDDDIYLLPPGTTGEWKVIGADWVPATAVATDGSDYRTLSLKNGSTVLGSLTTNSTGGAAWTAGTPAPFTLSGGTSLEFTARTDVLTFNATKTGGTGKVADGTLVLFWDRIS